ncbi:MAG: DUF424 family protein [Candidatus ainarchaeum sp.]|nr:DUF424 family protein [Candidatus ainarchaeum sp.]
MIKMFAKIHEIENRIILAVCDKELVGKSFEDKKIFFTASEKFYKEKEINQKDLETLLEEADSINLFGNKCIKIAEKQGLINETQIILINGIKHAQVYKV